MRACLIALLTLLSVSTITLAEEPAPRLISTNGEATVYVTPDQVVVSLGIETFDAVIGNATGNNRRLGESLVKSIKDLGVDEKEITASNVEISVVSQPHEEQQTTIKGYFVRRSYVITLKDLSLLDQLVETGLKQGANQLLGVEFQSTEIRKHRDEARLLAIKAAKDKAVAIATELGAQVGKVHTINEGGGSVTYGRGTWGNRNGNTVQTTTQIIPTFSETTGPLPLGQIAVKASVYVGFDLAD